MKNENIIKIIGSSYTKNKSNLFNSNDSLFSLKENIDKSNNREFSFGKNRNNNFGSIKKLDLKSKKEKSLPLITTKSNTPVKLEINRISPQKNISQNKRYKDNDFQDYINLVPIKNNLSNSTSKKNFNLNSTKNISKIIPDSTSTKNNNNDFRKLNNSLGFNKNNEFRKLYNNKNEEKKNLKSLFNFSSYSNKYFSPNIKRNNDKVLLSPITSNYILKTSNNETEKNEEEDEDKENKISDLLEEAKKKNKRLILEKPFERKKKKCKTNILRIKPIEDEEENNFEKIKFKAFSFSKAGILENNMTKINQDSILILNNIFNLKYDIFGIMDGHGLNGHLVSNFVKEQIKEIFTNQKTFTSKIQFGNLTEDDIFKKLTKNDNSFIKKIFSKISKNLLYLNCDINNSGTTCNLLIHLNNYLICINIGDSRCIILKLLNSEKINFECEKMSFDHKPNLKNEKKRIESLGGEIRQNKNLDNNQYEGPFRVFIKGEKFPGIAISRSIGDLDAKKIGVICDPDINIKLMENSFKIAILGSDGLWDVLNENDIIEILKKYWKKNLFDFFSKEIFDECINRWENKFLERDDISFIIVVINYYNKKR